MVEFFLSHPQTGKEIKEDLSKQCTCIVIQARSQTKISPEALLSAAKIV